MEKRYQVFVSSTYEDLREERQHVMQALLGLDCIPAGMELFPASDDDQWTFIKRVIDDCDYYVVITAGKYGSTDTNGVSYTEKEYDYAVEKGKPVISFWYEDLGKLLSEKCESDSQEQDKLVQFREKVKKKLSKPWHSAEDLAGKVALSVGQLKKTRDAEGWVKGRYATDADTVVRRCTEITYRIDDLRVPVGNALRGVPWAETGRPRSPRNATEGVPYKTKSVTYSWTRP